MKSIALTITFVVLFTAGVGNVLADRGHYSRHHSHFGVFIGSNWGPWYYPPYYYPPYGPQIVIEETPPPVYIEQPQQPTAPTASAIPAQNYWYYCDAQRAYFPYVQECPSGWQKVLPQPPAPN